MPTVNDDTENNMSLLEPQIIYEDDDLILLNKPAGLVVHSDGRTEESTLVEWVLARYPTLTDVGGLHTLDNERYVVRAGILHRLDRETSGIVLIAKRDEIFYFLQRQFLDRSIEKIYKAFVHGIPLPEAGTIELPIGRSRSDFRRWATPPDARGTLRPATTEYKVMGSTEHISLVECKPKTGRTHQIRVHMTAIGHPLVADARYSGAPALGFQRLALHAESLEITLPSGVRQRFSAPYPPDFAHALEVTMLGLQNP